LELINLFIKVLELFLKLKTKKVNIICIESTKSLPRDERFKLPSAKVFRLNTPGPGKYQI